MIVGNGPIILSTFGVLVGPITAEFGWRRGSLASAVLAAHVAGALVMPFMGSLLDRVGTRRVVLPALIAFAALFASVAYLPGNATLFICVYAAIGLIGAGHSTLPYSRAVSTWFQKKRGRALGVALAGVGIGQVLIPQVARLLVASHGWRGAYIGLAALILLIAFPAVLLLVRDRGTAKGGNRVARDDTAAAGMTLSQGIRTSQFWVLGAVLFLVAATVNGTIAHVVPLLTDRGVSVVAATAALSVAGLAAIAGRVLSGFCLDRFFAPYVAAFFFLLPLLGLCLLGLHGGITISILAAVLLGLGSGAEVDIMSFLIIKYFGLRHYGSIYGTLLALFTLGSGSGPWLIAYPSDTFGSYTPALIGGGIALMMASALVTRLGPYKAEY
jgi:MFS family permease